MRCDYHVHTAYSDDCSYPMEQVAADALRLGLEEICFTEHVDYGFKRDRDDPRGFLCRTEGPPRVIGMELANVDYPAYTAAAARIREDYAGRLGIKMGIEFGLQRHTIGDYQKLFPRYPWDFVLLSIHAIGDRELWNQEYQTGKTQQEYVQGYYEEMLAVVENYRDYSVLAHMDLISRYDLLEPWPVRKLEPILREILQRVVRDGKGIEVNTSYVRYGLKDLTPAAEILNLYRQLGGEILTIGSDSHKPDHLGSGIQKTQQLLKDLGFRYHCTYDRMEPKFHTL